MTNREQNTEMWSGDDVVLPFVIVDEENAPDPLSNFTAFTYAVRDKAGGTLLLTILINTGGFVGDVCSGILYLLSAWLGYNQPDMAGHVHDYGTKFLVTAGLLNILAMVDAFEIFRGLKNCTLTECCVGEHQQDDADDHVSHFIGSVRLSPRITRSFTA